MRSVKFKIARARSVELNHAHSFIPHVRLQATKTLLLPLRGSAAAFYLIRMQSKLLHTPIKDFTNI
jgi:hypothetical protein